MIATLLPQGPHRRLHGTVRLLALTAGALAVHAPGRTLAAQPLRASLAAGAAHVQVEAQPAFTSATLSPSLALQGRWVSLALDGTLSRVGTSGWSQQGTAVLSAVTPVSRRGVMLEAGGSTGGSSFPGGASTAQALGGLRLHRLGATTDLWVGGHAGAMSDGAAWRNVRQAEFGGSHGGALHRLTMAVSPTVTDDTLAYTDVLGVYATSLRGADLTFSVGGRAGAPLPIVGGEQRVWGGVGLAFWLAPRTTLQVGVGTYPVDVTQGFPAGRYASVAIRVGALRSPAATARAIARAGQRVARSMGVTGFSIARTRDGDLAVRVEAAQARRVELAGDVTGWMPVVLEPAEGGWWWARLPDTGLEVLEIALRVDGGPWIAPPGSDAVVDEFGGVSGRVVLPRPM